MHAFERIDTKLNAFAKHHNAEIHTKGTSIDGVPPEKIEERIICWKDGIISKSVLILPQFVSQDYDFPLWDFINLAWLGDSEVNPSNGVPFWLKHLLKKATIVEIEQQIDNLLIASDKNLSQIVRENLKRKR